MAEHEKGRTYKKKYISKDTPNNVGRNFFNIKNSSHRIGEDDESKTELKVKQPTILLKTREQGEEAVGSPKKNLKDPEPPTNAAGTTSSNTEAHLLKYMNKAVKFLDDGILLTENVQDYIQENSDFLVVGVIGQQGVGKSTILNLLANKQVTKESISEIILKKQNASAGIDNITNGLSNVDLKESYQKEIFKTQSLDDIENNRSRTNGMDIYISDNRVIFLDCQPFISMSVMDDLVENENKRSNLVSEFIPSENSGEIQSLQITSFLMSVCHILFIVQDWFLDSNVCRFVQTAEMLKPTISNPEDELSEYFPHILLIHNKATVEDFSPLRFKTMQKIYKSIFFKSKLMIETNLGMASGRLIKHLNPENCGPLLNIFLLPEYSETDGGIFRGHPAMEEILRKLRANIFGATKQPLTHVQLTEKTWLVYCSKVWETVRKNSFFVEYTKLMP